MHKTQNDMPETNIFDAELRTMINLQSLTQCKDIERETVTELRVVILSLAEGCEARIVELAYDRSAREDS